MYVRVCVCIHMCVCVCIRKINKLQGPGNWMKSSILLKTLLQILHTQKVSMKSIKILDSLEKEMATHSNILAWKSPWTEEPGGLQSMGLHDRACVHEGRGRWVGSNKVVELKKNKIKYWTLFHRITTNVLFLFHFIAVDFKIS